MRQGHVIGSKALIAACLVLFFVAADASARRFTMSGTWEDRRGQVFIPLNFPLSVLPTFPPPTFGPGPMSMVPIHTNLIGLGFPNGFHKGKGGVTATGGVPGPTVGASPPTLSIPTNRFRFGGMGGTGMFAGTVPLMGATLVQITTMFTANGPAQPAQLMEGYGMSFTFCPQPVTFGPCVAGGGMLMTDPPQGPGIGRRNGRVIYSAGKNKYGGVMQILLAGGGLNAATYPPAGPPTQIGHFPFGGPAGASAMTQHIGGSYSNMLYVTLKPGYVTQPKIPPTASGLILAPGGFVTTGGFLTTTPMGMGGKKLTIGLLPSKGQFTTDTGFPVTTGTVQVQQTTGTGGGDIFTVMGYDKRTALGAGAISLVAGGLSQRNTLAGSTRYAGYTRLFMTLGPKVPSLSPAGFAAAGALMLLAVGYVMRRRLK